MTVVVNISQSSARFKKSPREHIKLVMQEVSRSMTEGRVEGAMLEPEGGECFCFWKIVGYDEIPTPT